MVNTPATNFKRLQSSCKICKLLTTGRCWLQLQITSVWSERFKHGVCEIVKWSYWRSYIFSPTYFCHAILPRSVTSDLWWYIQLFWVIDRSIVFNCGESHDYFYFVWWRCLTVTYCDHSSLCCHVHNSLSFYPISCLQEASITSTDSVCSIISDTDELPEQDDGIVNGIDTSSTEDDAILGDSKKSLTQHGTIVSGIDKSPAHDDDGSLA